MFVTKLTKGRQISSLGLSFEARRSCGVYRTCRSWGGGYPSYGNQVKMDFKKSKPGKVAALRSPGLS